MLLNHLLDIYIECHGGGGGGGGRAVCIHVYTWYVAYILDLQ